MKKKIAAVLVSALVALSVFSAAREDRRARQKRPRYRK